MFLSCTENVLHMMGIKCHKILCFHSIWGLFQLLRNTIYLEQEKQQKWGPSILKQTQVESLHNTEIVIKARRSCINLECTNQCQHSLLSRTWQVTLAHTRGLWSISCLFILSLTLALSAESIQPLNFKCQCMPAPFLIAASLFKLQALSSKHLVSYYATKHPPLC